jgi:hypothetical protein
MQQFNVLYSVKYVVQILAESPGWDLSLVEPPIQCVSDAFLQFTAAEGEIHYSAASSTKATKVLNFTTTRLQVFYLTGETISYM